MRVPTWLYLLICAGLVIGNMYVYRAIVVPPVLTVTVLEVAKGKPVLVQSPSGKTVLIDTGADASILRALGVALPFWQRHLDAVVLTGTKKSFAGALPDVLGRYKVGTVIDSKNSFAFDSVSLTMLVPGEIHISYGKTEFSISYSTPSSTYTSNGETMTKIK